MYLSMGRRQPVDDLLRGLVGDLRRIGGRGVDHLHGGSVALPQRAVMDVMGWSHTPMTMRCQHLTGQVRQDIAAQLGSLLWANK